MSESAFSVFTKTKKNKHKKSMKSEKHSNGLPKKAKLKLLTSFDNETQPDKPLKKQKHKQSPSTLLTETNTQPSKPKKIKKCVPKVEETSNEVVNNLLDVENKELSPAAKAKKILSWLIYPMHVGNFFETYWESQPVHIIRDQADYYTSLMSSKDVDIMVREHPLFFGRNVDVVEYEDGGRKTLNPDGRATPSIVWDAYAQGCSVRILNPQTYNDTVHYVLATLQEYFGTMVGANIYLTPPGSQGFAPHYDDIEAFIIQLEGKKHWKLYKPIKDEDNLARVSSKDYTRDQLGDIIFDAVLNAGDILYFPRGIVHEAKSLEDTHSLHMTISSYQRTSYADLMEALLPNALQQAAEEDIDFRRGLPLNYLKHVGSICLGKQTDERMEVLKTVQKLFFKLASRLDIDSAADVLGRKFMYDAMPPVLDNAEKSCSSLERYQLKNGAVVNKFEITMNTEIRLVRYYACRSVREGDTATLFYSTQNARVYHGEEEQFIPMEANLAVVIEIMLQHYPDFVSLNMFPVKDEQSLFDFVTQLWDYGIVITK